MSWANSSSWPLLASRYVYPIFEFLDVLYILDYIIQFRAIPLGLMCCSCSLKWMERESFWTSCLTTWQCLPATRSPGKYWRYFYRHYWYVHISGPGSSCSRWTGQTPPPFSQSCATMFFVTGDTILYTPLNPHAFAVKFLVIALFNERERFSILHSSRYATRSLYGYCPQWALNWEYR